MAAGEEKKISFFENENSFAFFKFIKISSVTWRRLLIFLADGKLFQTDSIIIGGSLKSALTQNIAKSKTLECRWAKRGLLKVQTYTIIIKRDKATQQSASDALRCEVITVCRNCENQSGEHTTHYSHLILKLHSTTPSCAFSSEIIIINNCLFSIT